jgi:pectate lyase
MKNFRLLVKIAVLIGAVAFLTLSFALPSSPIGFASQAGGTTGGKGGTTHTVSTGTALQDLLKRDASGLIIYVNGTITPSNSPSEQKINVKEVSNISIIGSGANGIFNGVGIKIVKANNVIIQNLIIHHVNVGDKDCISIEGPVDHVWVDHCELYNDLDHDKDYYDGLLDAKAESEYITVSRCYLHDSYKTSLVGSSSGDTYDRKMTYCFNYFLDCNSRTPSYRGGVGHIFNNLFIGTRDTIGATAINSRVGAKLRIEGNYFQGLGSGEIDDDGDLKLPMGPIGAYYEEPGCWDVKDNIFVDCKGNQPTTSSCSYSPPYSYNLVSANEVRNNVWNDVGAQGTSIQKVKVERVRAAVASMDKNLNGPSFAITQGGFQIVSGESGSMNIRMHSIDGKTIASGTVPVKRGKNTVTLSHIGYVLTFNTIGIVNYSINGKKGTQLIVSNP